MVRLRPFLLASLLAVTTLAVSRQTGPAMTYNDTTVPTDIVMKGGHAYVSVNSVAKLLNAAVTQDGNTFVFKPLDNSRQVNGNTGKVGQMIRLGIGNVTVTDVTVTQNYKATHGGSDSTADAGKEIVAISMRIQNSTVKTQTLYVLGGDKTGLATQDGTSFGVSSFSDFETRAPDLLPGAAVEFTLLFKVPAGTALKDLVYELSYASLNKTAQARISIAPTTSS